MAEFVPSRLGLLVRRKREQLGIHQTSLAAKAGISSVAVSGLETGRNQRARLTTLQALARALELPEELLVKANRGEVIEVPGLSLEVTPSIGLTDEDFPEEPEKAFPTPVLDVSRLPREDAKKATPYIKFEIEDNGLVVTGSFLQEVLAILKAAYKPFVVAPGDACREDEPQL